MNNYKFKPIAPSKITPKELFYDRRHFMQMAGGLSLAAMLPKSVWAVDKLADVKKSSYTVGEELTPYNDVTSYNNFYEFSTDKVDPAENAGKFITRPWTVAVEGEVKKPKVFDIDELLKFAPL